MSHERPGKSDEWYTPKYIFEAMGVVFDLDVASAPFGPKVPCLKSLYINSLEEKWDGFIWMNPPYGGRNCLKPWLEKFFIHGNGICLVPDRTSSPWWQFAAKNSDAIIFVSPKIKFINKHGIPGQAPANGSCLMGVGSIALEVLKRARKLGFYCER